MINDHHGTKPSRHDFTMMIIMMIILIILTMMIILMIILMMIIILPIMMIIIMTPNLPGMPSSVAPATADVIALQSQVWW